MRKILTDEEKRRKVVEQSLRHYYKYHEREKAKYREKYHKKKENDTSGIYKIINTLNGKYYIGSSEFVTNRLGNHRRKLERNTHSNKHLQAAWNLYGSTFFDFRLVEVIPTDKLIEVEQKYLDVGFEEGNLYNFNREANRTVLRGEQASMFGKHHTLEQRKKWSEMRRGNGSAHADKSIYIFRNLQTGQVFLGTRCDLHEKFGIDYGNLSRLVNGTRKSCNQWVLSS